MKTFTGWNLLGAFPNNIPDDVGSWILHNDGEAMLLELPPKIPVPTIEFELSKTKSSLKYIIASHTHWDHYDLETIKKVVRKFPNAIFIRPKFVKDHVALNLGGEVVHLIKAPKHSHNDLVTIFKGVAMTGDIELQTLDSVNTEVSLEIKKKSMRRLKQFQTDHNYRIHTTISAHLNDFRENVNWPDLFSI